MTFRISLSTLLLLSLTSLSGCGSAASDDITLGQNDGPTLAEAAANLPRPDVPLIVDNSTSGVSGDNNADNVTIVDENTTVTVTGPSSSSATSSSASSVMRRFLWKPDSERDGNLVVLVDPVGIRVEVFGSISETLDDFGPSNDRGTTARGSFPGCSYGTNIVVEFYRGSQPVGFVDGRTRVTVPDGCQRLEFNL